MEAGGLELDGGGLVGVLLREAHRQLVRQPLVHLRAAAPSAFRNATVVQQRCCRLRTVPALPSIVAAQLKMLSPLGNAETPGTGCIIRPCSSCVSPARGGRPSARAPRANRGGAALTLRDGLAAHRGRAGRLGSACAGSRRGAAAVCGGVGAWGSVSVAVRCSRRCSVAPASRFARRLIFGSICERRGNLSTSSEVAI